MQRKPWAPALAGVIVATGLLASLAVAVHHDVHSRPLAKILAGPTPTSDPSSAAADTSSTTTPDTTTTTSAPPTSGSGPTTTLTGRPSSTPTPHPTTATTRPRSTAPTAAPSTALSPTPTRPGTYQYLQPGVAPTPAGTLVITAGPDGTEQWIQTIGQTTATSILLFNGSGVYTRSLTLRGDTCTFGTPVPSPPWPVAVGKTFAGDAVCTGPLAATLHIEGQVVGTEAVPLDGGTVNTFVVVSKITIAGIMITQTDWYAPSLRLAVKTSLYSSSPFLPLDSSVVLASGNPT